ncbi:tautomerase family protein [Neorhizobium sp. NPDC001467]|uniref:tautomerase family protein n=1 Tax=Neorhizobium sp. NPDC001467 TaxID=3390595 RepID=UPI003CFC23A2
MPLIKIHTARGRGREEIDALLDAIHEAMVAAFKVPERDRYQILMEHEPTHIRALDTGLSIQRSAAFVLLEVVSRPRTRDEKMNFYAGVCAALEARCGIAPSDVMITFVINSDDDWSFGLGRAQFVTGDL